jgi:uncharacterized protein YndB with AHSA1/START domain
MTDSEITPPTESLDRLVEVDIDRQELWQLVSTPDGWSQWLVDHADVDVVAGAEGQVVDDDVTRSVRIDSVDDGRRIGFTWWRHDDPQSGSHVELLIESPPAGPLLLRVTEHQVRSISTVCSVRRSPTASLDLRLLCETRLWLLACCRLATVGR